MRIIKIYEDETPAEREADWLKRLQTLPQDEQLLVLKARIDRYKQKQQKQQKQLSKPARTSPTWLYANS